MRRFRTIIAAFLLVIILVVIEIIIVKGASNYEPQSEVIFARMRIPERTMITADMLVIKKLGLKDIHSMALRSMKEVAGKRAKSDIEAGEMILSARLGFEGMEKIQVKDKTKRLFAVEFKGDQANGWWLMADQYVDILFIPNEKRGNMPIGNVQKLRGIRVAAMIDDNGKLLKNKDRTTLPKFISFEVSEQEAEFLAYAKSNGRLEVSVVPD